MCYDESYHLYLNELIDHTYSAIFLLVISTHWEQRLLYNITASYLQKNTIIFYSFVADFHRKHFLPKIAAYSTKVTRSDTQHIFSLR